MVFTPNKDRTLRFCVDQLRINALTMRHRYPILEMDECIHFVEDAKIVFTLDASLACRQVEVDKRDRKNPVFVT